MTNINKPGYSHAARSGKSLSDFIKNELAGNGIAGTSSVHQAAYFASPVATGLTAAGSNQSTALQLAASINIISTAASGTGVQLPAISTCGVGAEIIVSNQGANTIHVYTGDSSTIDGTAGATGITMAATHRAVFISTSSSTWISALLGAVAS
jgi:hypothetical protein